MIHWSIDMSADHYYKHTEGYAEPDEIQPIAGAIAHWRQQHGPIARVSSTAQRSAEFGSVKCSVTVSLDCPQDKRWIDEAARVSFKLALGYCNDGFSYLCPEAERIAGPR